MDSLKAFLRGLLDHIRVSDMGRTWDNPALNAAYDRGWNLADRLTGRAP